MKQIKIKNKLLIIGVFLSFIGISQQPKLGINDEFTERVNSFDFSSDGKLFLTITEEGIPRLWDFSTGKLAHSFDDLAQSKFACFSPDAQKIITVHGQEQRVKLSDLGTKKTEINLEGITGWLERPVYSPDGKYILAKSQGILRLWSVNTGEIIHDFDGGSHTYEVYFHPDGKTLITSDADETCKVWDVQTGSLIITLDKTTGPIGLSPNGEFAVTGGRSKNALYLWDVKSGKLVSTFEGHKDLVYSFSFSSNGKRILSSSYDNTVKLWSTKKGKLLHSFNSSSYLANASFSPNRNRILTTSQGDTSLNLWKARNGKLLQSFKGHSDIIEEAFFSPNGKFIVTNTKKTARLWDSKSGAVLKEIDFDRDHPFVFSSDGGYLLAHDYDNGIIEIFEGSSLKTIFTLLEDWGLDEENLPRENKEGDNIYLPKNHSLKSIYFSQDGTYIYTLGSDDLLVWESATGKQVNQIRLPKHLSRADISISPTDGSILVNQGALTELLDISTGNYNCSLKGYSTPTNDILFSSNGKYIANTQGWLWETSTGKLLEIFEGNAQSLRNPNVFNIDETLILTIYRDFIAIWNIETPDEEPVVLEGHNRNVNSAVFSPNGKYILSSADDGTAKLWDVNNSENIVTFEGHSQALLAAVFSPDGETVLTSSKDSTARLWDTSSGDLLHVLESTAGSFNGLFCPNGNFVLTQTSDTTLKIWDVKSGLYLHSLEGHLDKILFAKFSPDGKYIVSTGEDYRSIVWEVETGKKLYTRIEFEDGSWLTFDEHSRYDGTQKASEILFLECDSHIIEKPEVLERLHVSGLVELIMNGNNGKLDKKPKLKDYEICND